VLGLLVAMACLRLLPLLDLSSDLAGLSVQLDARVVAFASVLTLGTGLLFGLVPALRSSAAAVARAERRTAGSGSSTRPTMRNSLLVAQLALALVLLVGAGLALRTLWNLGRVPLGFDTHNLLLAPLDLAQRRDSTPGDLQIYANILEQTRSLAGVRQATLARISPFSGNRMANDIFWESSAAPGTRERTNVDMNVVDPAYFEALGISILAGRPFARADGPNATAVTIVNRALADRLWPGENPIGQRIWEWRVNQDNRALEVIGVVANGRYYRSWRNSDRPFLFLPLAQNPASRMTLHVRTDGVPSRVSTDLRRVIAQTDASIPRPMMLTAADAMSAAVALQRTNARLLTLFGVLATVVAMIGVYGVVSFTVSQRTHEIGVRMALGARAADVNRMILAGSARPMLLGSGVGLVVAALLARFLAPLLFGVGAWDPATYGTVAVLLIGIGLVATHIPARRATRLDPVAVLRE
jgi:putative ABC transport system permease protein